ncbi:MAG: hypothetical protein ACK56I_31065 [bacterium]
MPRNLPAVSDDAVGGHGCDRDHTATDALIAGCGSYPSRVKSS